MASVLVAQADVFQTSRRYHGSFCLGIVSAVFFVSCFHLCGHTFRLTLCSAVSMNGGGYHIWEVSTVSFVKYMKVSRNAFQAVPSLL